MRASQSEKFREINLLPELVNVSGLGMDFLVITLVSLVLSMELEPILNMDPRPRKSFEFRFFFRSSFC